MPQQDSDTDRRDEDKPQYQPGASQYRPQTVESDDEVNREIASEFDDRSDPEAADVEPQSGNDSRTAPGTKIDHTNPLNVPPPK
jgi:hypothetical protein